MPQPYGKAVMTDGGAALLCKAQAGKIKIEFTRVVTGSGVYSTTEKTLEALQARSALKEQKNSYPLSGIEIMSDHTIKVTALVTNQNPVNNAVLVNEGYYINEMGLYAKGQGDSEEILFCVTTTVATGDYMPAYNGNSPAQIVQDYFITISNTANVVVDVQNGAVALAVDLNAIKKKTDRFTTEEAGYLSGVRLPIQDQIDTLLLYGPPDTYMPPGSTLFVTDEVESSFRAAAFVNLEIRASPDKLDSLGLVRNEGTSEEIAADGSGTISGKITVAEKPESDAVFFAPINQNQ